MRKKIHPEKSVSGNFSDYTIIAAIENCILSLPILERCEVEAIERTDGSKDGSFHTMKTLVNRIRRATGLVVRLSVRDGYCIIQRIK